MNCEFCNVYECHSYIHTLKVIVLFACLENKHVLFKCVQFNHQSTRKNAYWLPFFNVIHSCKYSVRLFSNSIHIVKWKSCLYGLCYLHLVWIHPSILMAAMSVLRAIGNMTTRPRVLERLQTMLNGYIVFMISMFSTFFLGIVFSLYHS